MVIPTRRLLVLLLLLLAVPMKGLLAAGMVACGSGDSHESAITSASYGHDHPQAAHDDAVDAAGHGHQGAPGDRFDQHGDVTCALCAACCVGGAILNSLPLPSPLLERGDPAFPPVSERFLGFLSDRLDRPPQRTLV